MSYNNAPSGEIIYTSTTEIIGQGESHSIPFPYGSFVVAGKNAKAVGVVYHIETVSIDNNRMPMALGLDEDNLAESHPENSWLLRPQLKALLIGELASEYKYGIPPAPPPIHGELKLCSSEQLQSIAQSLGFLRLIYSSGKPGMEELLLSVCKHLITAHQNSADCEQRAVALKLGKTISDLYRDDYDTLRRMLERVESWLT